GALENSLTPTSLGQPLRYWKTAILSPLVLLFPRLLLSSWDGEYSRPTSDGTVGHVNWQPPERAPAGAVRNKLGRFFNAPRRISSCFGQRLDRIGSVSGLGCNRRYVSCNVGSFRFQTNQNE
uniref:Natriuretic peptides A n=1 Tax=Naja naja TaxID=35670 RepID=A0A8C6XQK7_NAJNA